MPAPMTMRSYVVAVVGAVGDPGEGAGTEEAPPPHPATAPARAVDPPTAIKLRRENEVLTVGVPIKANNSERAMIPYKPPSVAPLPVIDIGTERNEATIAREIRIAALDTGFFYIT